MCPSLSEDYDHDRHVKNKQHKQRQRLRRRETLTTQRTTMTQYLLHHDADEGNTSPLDSLLVVGTGSNSNAEIPSSLSSRIDWTTMASALDPLQGGKLHHAPRGLHKRQQVESLYVLLASLLPSTSSPHTRIVDFGCGSGNSSLALAALFPHCYFTLLDVKPTAIALAEQRAREAGLTNVSFFVGEADAWDAPFDLGLGMHCCGSLTDRIQLQCLAREAAYVLAPCCLGKIAHTPAAVVYPRSAWVRRGLRAWMRHGLSVTMAATVGARGHEGDGKRVEGTENTRSCGGGGAAAGVDENDSDDMSGGKEGGQRGGEDNGEEEDKGGKKEQNEDGEGGAALACAVTTSTTTADIVITTQRGNQAHSHAPPAVPAANAFFLPSYAILASAADHHSQHHAEDRMTKHLLELDRQQAAREQAPGYSVYLTHLTPLSCSEKNIVLVGLPQGWEGGRGGETSDVVSARRFLQRLGQEAAERKEERRRRSDTEKEGEATAVRMEGERLQMERVCHRAPRAERRRQRGQQAPLVPQAVAYSSSASPDARIARGSYLVRNRRVCDRPALPQPLPHSSRLEAGAGIHGAGAGNLGGEEEEKLGLGSGTCVESSTSAGVGLFCRLHHPEVMALARMATSRGKGIQRVV